MKTIRLILVLLPVIFIVGSIHLAGQQTSHSHLDWPQITKQTKPWTRWWWHGSIVDKRNLTIEMDKYVRAGLGGLEITPIYGVKGYEDRFINYLSPEWMEMLEHTLQEADLLGLGIDMATGTGWPFGGPWVGDGDACKYFTHKTYSLREGERLSESINFIQKPVVRAVGRRVSLSELKDPVSANTNLQALALDQVRFEKPLPLVTLMAFSDRGQKLDLTGRVGEGGMLDWTATAGNWTLYAAFQGWHGKMVERSAPGGEGNVIDHFSSTALKHYLIRFDQAFSGRNLKSLRAFFNDSYEVDDAEGQSNWTPNFLSEFQGRRGYDLRNHLPALFGNDTTEINSRVICDFRETISDLLLDEFTVPWDRWASSKGAITRSQAHGSPANILDLYAASDIPETEGQQILRMKFASSAANVTGKQLVSSESATWLNEHTLATLGDIKQAVDKFFLGGVNHIFYHGTPFSPENEDWPGRLFYAAVHFGPTNSFWNDFSALNQYVARCQSFLQSGRPDNDALLYYPIYDGWSEPGRTLLQHFGGGIDSALGQADGQVLLDAGYSYDMISDRQLTGVSTSNKLIQTGGTNYKAIVLPETKIIPHHTFNVLVDLARKGATVIVRGSIPSEVPGLGKLDGRRSELKKLVSQLRFTGTGVADIKMAKIGNGRFLVGSDMKQLLPFAGIKRETMVDHGLQFVRRRDGQNRYYFIVNNSNIPVDGWVPIQTDARSLVAFNPMHETNGMAALRRSADGTGEVYLQLAPGESVILKTMNRVTTGPSFGYLKSIGEPIKLEGEWTVQFVSGGPELPVSVKTRELKSWTEFGGEAIKRFSGTAVYSIDFQKPSAQATGWVLDLGRVAESARVTLNGREPAVLINAPYRIRIPNEYLMEHNKLEISVSNLMANRIIDLDRRGIIWKKFYNINMPARRRENVGPDGLFNASRWSPLESGLIGPVVIKQLEFIRF